MPSPLRLPKSKEDRIAECLMILKQLEGEYGVTKMNPSYELLSVRMMKYWETGRFDQDRIPLVGSNRYILYKFPKWSHEIVEIILRVGRITHRGLPADLEAEACAGKSNVQKSDQAPPSQTH
jgi:hypothetical protein